MIISSRLSIRIALSTDQAYDNPFEVCENEESAESVMTCKIRINYNDVLRETPASGLISIIKKSDEAFVLRVIYKYLISNSTESTNHLSLFSQLL